MRRQFTVSGFVVEGDRTSLHWQKLQLWLPPGGHVDPDEDPVQATVREVLEETGIAAEDTVIGNWTGDVTSFSPPHTKNRWCPHGRWRAGQQARVP